MVIKAKATNRLHADVTPHPGLCVAAFGTLTYSSEPGDAYGLMIHRVVPVPLLQQRVGLLGGTLCPGIDWHA